jgi:hypothetical protein
MLRLTAGTGISYVRGADDNKVEGRSEFLPNGQTA